MAIMVVFAVAISVVVLLLFWLHVARETLPSSAPLKISNKSRAEDDVIVIGAGMTGLLVAAVCAKYFRNVKILEAEGGDLSDYSRTGTPQAPHIHILSGVFLALADSILPGFKRKLLSEGAVVHKFGLEKVHIQTGSSVMCQTSDEHIERISCSRSLAERTCRRLLLEMFENVHISNGVVKDYYFEEQEVVGAHLADGHVLKAHLVVDCSGNHSNHRSRRNAIESSLSRLDSYAPNITYCSTLIDYEKPLKYSWFTVLHDAPTQTKSASLVQQEPMTVGKCTYLLSIRNNGEAPPTEKEDMISFCASLNGELRGLLEQGDWTTKVSKYNVSKSFKYTYRRLPLGLLIFGDALCVTNPAYGKGMTISAKSAKLLADSLEQSYSQAELSSLVGKSLNAMLDSEFTNAMLHDLLFDEIEPFLKRPFVPLAQVFFAASLRRLSSKNFIFKRMRTIIVGSNTNSYRIYHPILVFYFFLNLLRLWS